MPLAQQFGYPLVPYRSRAADPISQKEHLGHMAGARQNWPAQLDIRGIPIVEGEPHIDLTRSGGDPFHRLMKQIPADPIECLARLQLSRVSELMNQ